MWPIKFHLRTLLLLCLLLPVTFAARCQNRADVFIGGKIFFLDGDCYSRMTRVQKILQSPWHPVRHHDFENYPEGTKAHTTAPLDYLIAFLSICLARFSQQPVDMAGALVSPLLGCATLLVLWWWGIQMRFRHLGAMLLLFAISPILVHGNTLGRPDHQSLLVFLLAIAIGSEWKLVSADATKKSRGLWILSGLSWGLSLWVSFYEPLVCLLAVGVAHLLFNRHTLWAKERRAWIPAFLLPIALLLLVEGRPFTVPDATSMKAFLAWKQSIGELSSLAPFSPLLLQWTGLFLFAAPFLLLWKRESGPGQPGAFLLLAVLFGLTLWQIRWGYFFVLVFAMSLPWQLEVFPRRWLAWFLFALSLWPVLREWDQRLYPTELRTRQLAVQRWERFLLRDMADQLPKGDKAAILAPWWMCPPLAYWTGHPTVAGSSHESLPGIVDTARFYLTDHEQTGRRILSEHEVRWVLGCEPTQVIETSRGLVEPGQLPLVTQLYEHPNTSPAFLKLHSSNALYKWFMVLPEHP